MCLCLCGCRWDTQQLKAHLRLQFFVGQPVDAVVNESLHVLPDAAWIQMLENADVVMINTGAAACSTHLGAERTMHSALITQRYTCCCGATQALQHCSLLSGL